MNRQIYVDKTDPVIFLTVPVNTSGHVYDDFVRLFSYMRIVMIVFYPKNYLWNFISFAFFESYIWRILRTL